MRTVFDREEDPFVDEEANDAAQEVQEGVEKEEGQEVSKSKEDHLEVTAFITSKGVTVGAHYDEPANFFLQLYGMKRISLWPMPVNEELRSSENLRFYPWLHPHARHYANDSLLGGHGVHDAPPLVQPLAFVTLKPGDVLYLPPFTIHKVEALSQPTMR